MSDTNQIKQNSVVPLRPSEQKYHRVRIMADPKHPKTVEVVEDLLSRCELSRCECTTDEGVSTWSLIVPEDFLDLALECLAVTVPVDREFFESGEGKIFYVTREEWFRLGGAAEDTARCWGGDSIDGFQTEVNQQLRAMIQMSLQDLPWPGDGTGDEIFGRIENKVTDEMDVLTWGEDEIREAVRKAYEREKNHAKE
jgi:hypothetical protein